MGGICSSCCSQVPQVRTRIEHSRSEVQCSALTCMQCVAPTNTDLILLAACVSVCQAIEENIFDILPRDPTAPDDLFKPLDVHFARNNTLSNLLALYPSRRLPQPIVTAIWQHYFESFLLDGPHSHSAYANPPRPANTPSHISQQHKQPSIRAESFERPSISAHTPQSPRVEEENVAEITSMQWFLTDVLRHDLACLKERYDEVLAASLSMPAGSSASVGFSFNPVPILKAIRGELQRLNNMPIDYLARVLLKEMKGLSEEDEFSSATPTTGTGGAPRRPSNSLHSRTPRALPAAATLMPVGSNVGPATDTNTGAGVTANSVGPSSASSSALSPPAPTPTTPVNPLDKTVSATPASHPPSSPPSHLTHTPHTQLAPLASPRPHTIIPRLTLHDFASNIDFAMKTLFDRYYRKGYWVLFSLNLVHNARKVHALFSFLQPVAVSPRPLPLPQLAIQTGTWSDRISSAHLAATSEQPPTKIKLRKDSGSINTNSISQLAGSIGPMSDRSGAATPPTGRRADGIPPSAPHPTMHTPNSATNSLGPARLSHRTSGSRGHINLQSIPEPAARPTGDVPTTPVRVPMAVNSPTGVINAAILSPLPPLAPIACAKQPMQASAMATVAPSHTSTPTAAPETDHTHEQQQQPATIAQHTTTLTPTRSASPGNDSTIMPLNDAQATAPTAATEVPTESHSSASIASPHTVAPAASAPSSDGIATVAPAVAPTSTVNSHAAAPADTPTPAATATAETSSAATHASSSS